MNQVLVKAIEQKQRLRFLYNGKVRLVEPQCYGIGTRGTELLRAHQLQGGQEREPLFDVSKIADLEALNEVFVRPGPNYKKDDSAMTTIFAQL
jgi:predicted DNA-binding transcriptional regulator YafY